MSSNRKTSKSKGPDRIRKLVGDPPRPELQVRGHAPLPFQVRGDLSGTSPDLDLVHQGILVGRGQDLHPGPDEQKESSHDEHGRADEPEDLASDGACLEVKRIVVPAQSRAAELPFKPRAQAQRERGQGPDDDRLPDGPELCRFDDQALVPDDQGIVFGRDRTPDLDVVLCFDGPKDNSHVDGIRAGHADEVDRRIPDPFDRRELGRGDLERPLEDIPDPPALAGEDEEDDTQGSRRCRQGPPSGPAGPRRRPVVRHVPLRVKPDRG